MAELTREQKKDYARQLYLNDSSITQAEIAERVGVSKVTVCKWVKEGKWEELQTSLLVGKDVQLARLYGQLKRLNDAEDDIRAALEMAPDDAYLYLLRAKLNKLRFERDEMQRDIDTAVALGLSRDYIKQSLEE